MVLVQRLHLQFEVLSALFNWPLGVFGGISSPWLWLGTSWTLASAPRGTLWQPALGLALCHCSAITAFLGNVVSLSKMPFLVLPHHIPPSHWMISGSLQSFTLLKTHCTLAEMEIFFSSTSNRQKDFCASLSELHSLFSKCKKIPFENNSLSFCSQLLRGPCRSFL